MRTKSGLLVGLFDVGISEGLFEIGLLEGLLDFIGNPRCLESKIQKNSQISRL